MPWEDKACSTTITNECEFSHKSRASRFVSRSRSLLCFGFLSECQLPSDKIANTEIGILCHTNKQLKLVEESFSAHGIDTLKLSSEKADVRSNPGVRLCTMHRAKGLEFKAVAIPFMSNNQFPPKWLLDKAIDEADKEDLEGQLKSLLHVAATRAIGHLRVSWSGVQSQYFSS